MIQESASLKKAGFLIFSLLPKTVVLPAAAIKETRNLKVT
jgi:hypothetical protein